MRAGSLPLVALVLLGACGRALDTGSPDDAAVDDADASVAADASSEPSRGPVDTGSDAGPDAAGSFCRRHSPPELWKVVLCHDVDEVTTLIPPWAARLAGGSGTIDPVLGPNGRLRASTKGPGHAFLTTEPLPGSQRVILQLDFTLETLVGPKEQDLDAGLPDDVVFARFEIAENVAAGFGLDLQGDTVELLLLAANGAPFRTVIQPLEGPLVPGRTRHLALEAVWPNVLDPQFTIHAYVDGAVAATATFESVPVYFEAMVGGRADEPLGEYTAHYDNIVVQRRPN